MHPHRQNLSGMSGDIIAPRGVTCMYDSMIRVICNTAAHRLCTWQGEVCNQSVIAWRNDRRRECGKPIAAISGYLAAMSE